MITDANLALSGSLSGNVVTGQSLIAGIAAATLSTNTVDMLARNDIGEGEDVLLRMQFTAALVGPDGVIAELIGADDAALTAGVQVIASTGEIPAVDAIVGARFVLDPSPIIGSLGKRFLGMRYTNVGAAASTAGAVFADLGVGYADGEKFYPSGFAVL